MDPQKGKNLSEKAKKRIILTFVLLAACAMVLFYLAEESPHIDKIIGPGDPAPEFHLLSLDGRPANLSDFRGKVVMVHFWATWCPPCVDEIPTIDRFSHLFSDKDFQVLAVSVDDSGDSVSSFVRRKGLDLQVLLDPGRKTAKRYGTFKFPETYIVDRNGIVRYKAIGARNWTAPPNVDIVRELIGQR